MKLPQPFTICDLRFAIPRSKGSARVPRAGSGVAPEPPSSIIPEISTGENFVGRSFRRNAENHTRDACAPQPPRLTVSNRKSQIVNRKSSGIALVITLIMLSVTLVMAVAFLAIARRERGSVTTTTDTTTARLAAESAVAQAEAQIVANMLYGTRNGGSSNAFNLRLLVSTNYINPLGFTAAGGGNPTNVSYFDPNGNRLTGVNFMQSMSNLFFLPRAPVMISSSEPLGRFYLDLNENGRFEQNGAITNYDNLGNPIYDASGNPLIFAQGDPEWVGVLEHPDAPHGPNNHFISRYAFIALPVGNSLDLNYIHNQALNNGNVTTNSPDNYFRNQGVGSWEINLAAFLADLNTNIWGQFVGSGQSAPAGAGNFYLYNEASFPQFANSGDSFYDARGLLAYRYNNSFLASAAASFTNTVNYPFNVDAYSDGPLQTTLSNNAASIPDNPTRLSWPGAYNPTHVFTLSDFFDSTKNAPHFVSSLINTGKVSNTTYDRYTYYRMLDQLGSDSAPDEGKVNLNYSNAVVNYTKNNGVFVVTSLGVVAGAETNLVPWRPLDFFLAAADQMLRTYSTSWFQSNPSNYLATYYGIRSRGYLDASGLGVTNVQYLGQRNQIPAFGITNIPVLVNSNFVYTPAINRLLQLAANLYDATTNGNNNLPHVFRPVFKRDAFGNIFIVSYTAVTNVTGSNDRQLAPPMDVTALVNLGSAGVPIQNGFGLVNVYGVPWIIGAKKGLPNFNQFYLINAAQVTRKLQIKRSSLDPATAVYTTNQMYDLSISNNLGITFWNSYNADYPRPLTIYVHDVVTEVLSNSTLPVWSFRFDINGVRENAWPGSKWSGVAPNATPQTSSLVNANWSANYLPDSICYVAQNTPLSFPLNTWTSPGLAQFPQVDLVITNRLQAFILDGNNVIDYVQLRDPVTSGGLNQALADPDYPNGTGIHFQWSTNAYPVAPAGVMNQLDVSGHYGDAPSGGGQWSTAPTSMGLTTPKAEAAFFGGFFTTDFQYNGKNYVNSQLVIQAPYTPTRTVFSSYLLQVNDPLVHYLASDLNSQNGALAVWGGKNDQIGNGLWYNTDHQTLPTPPTTPIGGRYQPWGQNKQMMALANVDTNGFNLAYKDPLVWGPTNWDFPTSLYPTVGWIGRVHRGTPWQTVYLKSANTLKAANAAGYDAGYGTNTWANWTGNLLWHDIYGRPFGYAQYFDAANSSPVQDRLLFDVFTTRFNDNAVRGTLPVNQTHLASWSALFSGMVTLFNNTAKPLPSSRPTYLANIVNPAGVMDNTQPYTNWPAIAQIVNGPYGINVSRANTNVFPFQSFTHVGDILQTPALTAHSPFLNWNDSRQQDYGISDELYEWLPQQMMGLVRLGEARYVVYCYGQTLKPAPGGEVLGGPFYQMITNYQVTAESVVRAVIRVENANTSQPHAVVESYNTLPPN
jgi:hypothetical protein